MDKLLRAAWALIVDNYQDELEDPIGHHQREKAKLRQLSAPTVEKLFAAHDAYVTEIRRRRAESSWRGPFKLRDGAVWDTTGSGVLYGSPEFCDNIAAALNAFYGYGPNGEDLVKEMEG